MTRLRILTCFAVAMTAICSADAQQIGHNTSTSMPQGYTLSIRSQLVVETVTVQDKQGRFVPGLTAKDFALTEDGVPQTIRFCEHQNIEEGAQPLPALLPEKEQLTLYKRLDRTRITPENSSGDRYKNRRLLALYFDMSTMRPEDQLRALTAAEQFLRTQMTSADLVAILRYQGGSVDILQDFTADRNRLLSILQTMIVGEGQGSKDTIDDASSADTGAAFGQDDSEFNIFNTDRQLSALQTAAKMLGTLSEKKSLIYFASGLKLNGIDNQAQLHATVDAAIKAGVSFWPIDARGLVAEAPLGDATQGSPGNQGIYTGAAARANTNDLQHSQDTLYALAGDTGGKALFDTNDLTRGITQAQHAIADYYILGYYTTDNAENGRFRRVKISLTNGADAALNYREGYFAAKKFSTFNAVDKERQLEDALMLEDPITDLSMAMEIDYFQLNRAEYFVPIVVKIPGSELALAKRGGAEHTLIDFVGEIKDVVGGVTVTNVRDNVNIKLSDETAAQLAHLPIEYDTGFTLLPGRYSIKFLARDDETGRIGTYETEFTIPDLNREVKHVPISSVVLSSQRVDLSNALYTVAKGKKQDEEAAVNPLVADGRKLVPSVNRVFSTTQTLYVYLQAYKRPVAAVVGTPQTKAAEPLKPLVSFVSLFRGGQAVVQTQPEAGVPSAGSRLGLTDINATIPLAHLPPGNYTCQVTVLDPATQRATFWRAPLLLVP
jgi:VWFA-related protein